MDTWTDNMKTVYPTTNKVTKWHNSYNADPSAPIFLANVHCLMGKVWCNFQENREKATKVIEQKP